jgi:hypothetical protein
MSFPSVAGKGAVGDHAIKDNVIRQLRSGRGRETKSFE